MCSNYAPNNGKLTSLEYGNGQSINYTYDSLNRVSSIEKYWNSTDHYTYNYKYDNIGNITQMYDGANDFTTNYIYDSIGRFVSSLCSNGFGIAYRYDVYNRLTKTLAQNGFKGYNTLPNAYGMIEPITVSRSTMMIQNGHHRVAVLAKYGVENIKVFLK